MLEPVSKLLQINKVITNVRFKNPPHHWSSLRKQERPTQKALSHFDDFYKQIYNHKWESIRKALLAEKKYVAVINNFGDVETVISNLERIGALNMRTLFELGKQKHKRKEKKYIEKILSKSQATESSEQFLADMNNENMNYSDTEDSCDLDPNESVELSQQLNSNRLVDMKNALSAQILQEFIPATKIKGKEDFVLESSHYKLYNVDSELGIKFEKENDIHFPEHLKIYCFEKSNDSKFDPPKKAITDVYNYYLMDGGSVLPVLALDIQPGNRVLDMCASPGGKSLLAIQTLYPITVVSNDVSYSRLNRVHGAYNQFLFDFDEKWVKSGKVTLTNLDGRLIPEGAYDRILVDAPCSTDRHSLTENDNNIFKGSRIKERLQLPVLQKELLVNALKLVKKDGIVVYSTCSLNPIENDGVVHMALKEIWEETHMEFIVKNMYSALTQTKDIFEIHRRTLKYGHLVLPVISQNYGPTYFCKLQRSN